MRSGVSRAVLVSGAVLLLGQARFGRGPGLEGYRPHRRERDRRGRPARSPGATLKAACAERGGGTTLTTDKKGHWVLGGVVACNWAFDIEAAGYEPKQIAIRLPAESARLAPVKVPLEEGRPAPPPELRRRGGEGRCRVQGGPLRGGARRVREAARAAARARAHHPPADRVHVRAGEAVRQGREELEKVLEAEPGNAQVRAIAVQAALEGRMVDRARSCSPGSTSRRSRAPTSSSTWA